MLNEPKIKKLKHLLAAFEDPYLKAEAECKALGVTIEQVVHALKNRQAEIDHEIKLTGNLYYNKEVHEVFDPQFARIQETRPMRSSVSFDESFVRRLERQPNDKDHFRNLGRLRSYVRSEALKSGYKCNLGPDGRFLYKNDRDSGYKYYFIHLIREDGKISKLTPETRSYLDALATK